MQKYLRFVAVEIELTLGGLVLVGITATNPLE
jgi:hypothetical protein